MNNQYQQHISERHILAINMAIEEELNKALAKFPWWPTDFVDSVAILIEESGETMKAALQHKWDEEPKEEIYKEATQTAAMCFRVMAHLLDSETGAVESEGKEG